MVQSRPIRIPGRWRDGYALDYHTVRSEYVGDDELGQPQFQTERTEVGQLLYELKYRGDAAKVAPIVEAIAALLTQWKPQVDLLIPVPASRARARQPVQLIAAALSNRVGLASAPNAVRRAGELPELKNVYAYDERIRLLAGAHAVDIGQVRGRKVLLFDDLYRSGATMSAITTALYDVGGAADVYALTVTRTRSNR